VAYLIDPWCTDKCDSGSEAVSDSTTLLSRPNIAVNRTCKQCHFVCCLQAGYLARPLMANVGPHIRASVERSNRECDHHPLCGLAARCATGGHDLRNLDRIQSCRAVTRNLCGTTAARDPSAEHIHAAAGSALYRSYNRFSGSDEERSPYTLPANCDRTLPPPCRRGNEVRESTHQQHRHDMDAPGTARKLDGAQRPVVAMAYRANSSGDRSTLLADFGRAIQP